MLLKQSVHFTHIFLQVLTKLQKKKRKEVMFTPVVCLLMWGRGFRALFAYAETDLTSEALGGLFSGLLVLYGF